MRSLNSDLLDSALPLRQAVARHGLLMRPDVPFDMTSHLAAVFGLLCGMASRLIRLVANAMAGELFARRVWEASIDDLPAMKRIANPKDQLDIVAPRSLSDLGNRMSEADRLSRAVIPEHLMLSRLAQSEPMRDFFVQIWIQNFALAKQGEIKVQNPLSPLAFANAMISPNSPTGFTVDIEGDGK